MNKVRKLWLKVGLITAALASVIVATTVYIAQPTYAQVSDVIKKKAVAYGISQCYKQGYMNSPVTASSYNAGWGPSSLVNYGGSYAQPTGAYGDGYSLTLSCSELLNGNGLNGTFQGAFSWVNAPENANNTTAFSSFMTGIGYTKSNASAGQCASFTYRSGNSVDTLKLCAETDNGQANGKITGKITVSGDGGINVTFKTTDTTVEPVCSQFGSWASSCSVHSYTQGTTQFDTLMGEIMGDLIENRKNGIMFGDWKLDENVAFEPMGETLATYTITNKTTAANKATSYLTGYSGSNIALTPNEQLALLQDYMLNFYAIERYGGACDLDDSQANVAKNAGYSLIETSMFGSGLQKCWVRPTKNKNSSVTGFDKDGYFTGTPLYYDDVVGAFGGSVEDLFKGDKEKCNTAATNALNAANSIVDMYYLGSTTKEEHDRALKTIDELNAIKKQHGQYWHEENGTIVCYPFTNVDGTVTDTPTDSTTPPDTPTTNPEDPGDVGLVDGCFNNSGALGWIICPVLRMAGAATTGIYQSIADNYLTVKSDTMTSEALRGVWSDFQGYANILFAILLVIVILSQVTGVGLSNYGIKKVLPRLIITIILVNLSFILCSVAVDLSNILGTSLNDLFMNWNVGGYVAENLNIGTMIGNTIESLFSVGAGTAITVVGIKVAIATGAWEGIILSLLLTVIVAFVSIIFFYIILGVRQAAIVILIAVAPVAIVCYALPNTQKVFDRWLKIFSSLLLVFPICGLLMGGSNFASRLLLAANGEVGFMYFLVAMLLSVIPLFFVPTVLKSSMSAMGNLGTKISNMGSRFGNWSSRTVRGTRAFQERQQEAMRNSNMTRNQKIMDKTKLSDAQQTRLAALRAKRASGATLTSNERRELRELGSRQYRYARAASARERGVMEDAMADVASRREMLEHGSARYEKIVAGAMREQRNRDDAGQIALYEDGKVDAFGGGGKVRGDSLDDLAKEHAALLAHVADNPEDEIAASKLRAVQTLLGKMGPNGFDKMEDNFGSLMANHSQFSSANSKGLGIATSHLSRNFAGQIKANSRTFDKMLTDFNSDRFSQQGTFAQQTFTDALGKTQTKYMSSYYGAQGAQSIKAENVNDLGDTYYDNLLRATITGDLQGKDLEQVLNVFNEAEAAAAAGKLTLKGEVRQRIQAIKNAAYASSALNSGVRSEGSRMIGAAGAAGIDSIVKQIESAGDWSTMSTAERKQYSDLVNNITDSLKKDAHTVEDVRQLQQALATARGKNIETAVTGGALINQVGTADLHSYKIPRGSKQKVTMPTGWTKTTGGTWIDIATGAPLNMTDAAKAEKILEHNASIDVENDA